MRNRDRIERHAVGLGETPPRAQQAGHVPTRWRSHAMNECLRFVTAVARMPRQPVYVHGESGVGKTAIARELHRLRRGAGTPFVAILLSGLREEVAASELFGSERGAFTDAIRRDGLLRTANLGTAFLDEIAKSPLGVQADLLHVLDDRSILSVGGCKRIVLDLDLTAASSGDPKDAVSRGALLPDLLARFVGFTLHVPALRDRREDLPALILDAAWRTSDDLGRAEPPSFTDALMAALIAAPWPENFRGLLAALKWIVAQAGDAAVVGEAALCERVRSCMGTARRANESPPDDAVLRAVANSNGNQSAAARELMVNRSTITRRIKRLKRDDSAA